MGNRYKAVTVVFEKDVHDEDLPQFQEALKMIRGVAEVIPIVSDAAHCIAKTQLKYEFREKLWEFFKDF